MGASLKLTRDQLSSFLKDPEQIKQFEKLFSAVDQAITVILPSITTDVGQTDAQTYETIAQVLEFGHNLRAESGLLSARIEQCIGDLADLRAIVASDCSEARYNELLGVLQGLRSDLNGLEALAIVPEPPKRRRTGNFYDTTTQTAAAINTAYALTFNTTDLSDGVYIGSPTSRVYVDTEAIYNLQYSAQFDNTSGGNHLAFIWYRINGTDVANSASQVRLKGTDGELVAAWNFVAKLKAGDYFELMYSVTDTAVQVIAQAASAPVPAIPSVILSVTTV